jgi:hypothetical protein
LYLQGVGLRLSVAGGLSFPMVASLERGGSAEACGRIRQVTTEKSALAICVFTSRDKILTLDFTYEMETTDTSKLNKKLNFKFQ